MEKKLRSIALVLFSICCAIGFSTSVSAETLEMTSDMTASQIKQFINDATDDVVIDGQGQYKITERLTLDNGENVTFKDVTFDGEGVVASIMLYLTNAGNVVIDNVDFINYGKTGIYAVYMKSLSITNSTFDALETFDLVDQDFEAEEADEMRRSAAGIDLNLGNDEFTYLDDVVYNVESITIKDNTFKNVVVKEENRPTSTAGAIKIKIKDANEIDSIGTIRIEGNIFENNWQDLVIGTNSVINNNTLSSTGDLQILLVNNKPEAGVLNVKDNSTTEDGLSGGYVGNFKINGQLDYAYLLDENLYYVVDEDNIDAITDEEMAAILLDEDVAGFAVTVDGVTFAISRETLLDEDLGASLDDFDIVPSEETAIESLTQYMSEGVMFFTISGIDLFDDGITYDVSSLGEEFVGTLYLYYYDETNGLQLVSNPDNSILAFDKNGTYVLSATNLIPSTSSEEVPEEEVPEVPQTFDALGIYAGIGLVSVAGIVGAVVYLKRRNA